MIEAIDVYGFLSQSNECDDIEYEQAVSACRRSVKWIENQLKDGVDSNSERVLEAAAAMAKYYIFCSAVKDETSFKAGDVSVSRNKTEELDIQLKMLEISLAQASDILKDGGFCFVLS